MTLTTTSYAILGLLDLRDYTAYELAQQSKRSLAFAWPISESQLYAEPKRLAREGLIEISGSPAGPSRQRQVYAITEEGRLELRRWLGTQPNGPRLQAEVLLRCLFATSGTVDDLTAALVSTREQVDRQHRAGLAVIEDMVTVGQPFPERLHVNLLWMRLLRDVNLLIADWVDEALAETARWSAIDDSGDAERTLQLLRDLPVELPQR